MTIYLTTIENVSEFFKSRIDIKVHPVGAKSLFDIYILIHTRADYI